MRKKAWEEEKKSLSLTDIQSQLPAMKKDAALRKAYGAKRVSTTISTMIHMMITAIHTIMTMMTMTTTCDG